MSRPFFTSIFGESAALSYTEAILQGQADDGGLYFFTAPPLPGEQFFKNLSGQKYLDQFLSVNGLFVTDIPSDEQWRMAATVFTQANFKTTTKGNFAPVRHIADNIFIQRLGGGPTGAFKDFALLPVARHMDWALAVNDQTLYVLAATSGDTGPAAENAVNGLPRIHVTMLSPAPGYGMSEVQRSQMGALSGPNITNIAVPAGFTTCQDIVTSIKKDSEFRDLGAINSINIARVLAQVPYKVSAYLQVIEQAGLSYGDLIDAVIPSGNFGNALATFVAREMGLPIGRIIVATNENDFLDELIQTGRYRKRTEAEAVRTNSTSMDINYANNAARIIYRVFGNDPATTKAFMQRTNDPDGVAFADFGINNTILKTSFGFDSNASTATDRSTSIQWVYEASKQRAIIDPHTADGVTAARKLRIRDRPIYIESTADPFKFGDAIQAAIGVLPPMPDTFEAIIQRSLRNPEAYMTPDAGSDNTDFVKQVLRRQIEVG